MSQSRGFSSSVAVRAVTAWSLVGSYDWDSLLTVNAGRYEPGVFSVADGTLRRTPLAAMVEGLARGAEGVQSPAGEGWWLREERLLYRRGRKRLDAGGIFLHEVSAAET
jgi:dTDP-4-dehydrorhamnose reductase